MGRVYLRIRGGFAPCNYAPWVTVGLPPHTRRVPRLPQETSRSSRSTSAYAEGSVGARTPANLTRVYLRIRGGFGALYGDPVDDEGLPPHTRRVRDLLAAVSQTPGSTSAYAEGSESFCFAMLSIWVYLRIRGGFPT